MKLGQKNLVYGMVLAGIMLAFLVGYFSYMLPSLYVDYCMEQNLLSIRRQHAAYMDTGNYDGIPVRNSTACYSVDIPLEGDSLAITGKFFSVDVQLKDERLLRILEECREGLRGYQTDPAQTGDKGQEKETGAERFQRIREELEEVCRELYGEGQGLPLQIRIWESGGMEDTYFNETMKYHVYSDSLVVLETGVEDRENRYTNYIAVQWTKNRIVLSFLPVVTPELEEIRPIVWQSLPMLGAVVILMVLLASQMYSRGIVTPIVELSNHAEQMKYARDFCVGKLEGKWENRRDEIKELAGILDDFYHRIREGYMQLQEKNAQLEAENEREEVFLRTSAHQLKTPVAAALLLTDGMIHGVGKYQDVGTYLPKVKEQLLSMRKMTEDILYLNRCVKEMQLQMIDIGELLQEKLKLLEPVLAERRLQVEYREEMKDAKDPGDTRKKGMICTDERMFSQIVDILLSNAVAYTPMGERLRVWVSQDGRRVRIENYGARISETLLPRIFEPFVGGDKGHCAREAGGHGLGLYIAAYFAKKLGITLSVTNKREEDHRGDGQDGVVALVTFQDTGSMAQAGVNLQESFTGTSSELHMDRL